MWRERWWCSASTCEAISCLHVDGALRFQLVGGRVGTGPWRLLAILPGRWDPASADLMFSGQRWVFPHTGKVERSRDVSHNRTQGPPVAVATRVCHEMPSGPKHSFLCCRSVVSSQSGMSEKKKMGKKHTLAHHHQSKSHW